MSKLYVADDPQGVRLQGVKELTAVEVAELSRLGFTLTPFKMPVYPRSHEDAGRNYPPGEGWTPVGKWPNGKTLAHLMGCRACRESHDKMARSIAEFR